MREYTRHASEAVGNTRRQFVRFPANNPATPSLMKMLRHVLRKPVYAVEVCARILIFSMGAVNVRDATPATPPANMNCTNGISVGGSVMGTISEPKSNPCPAAHFFAMTVNEGDGTSEKNVQNSSKSILWSPSRSIPLRIPLTWRSGRVTPTRASAIFTYVSKW